MASSHEAQRKEFERQRIEKARRLAETIDGPMRAPEIARRMGVVLQTAHTLLDEAIRQGFVAVVGEKARGKACLFVRADATTAQADAARALLDRAGQARERILAACPALLGLGAGHEPVEHPGVARVDAVDLFDHLNPLRLRIVQIVDGFGGIASAREVGAVMAEHGFELPGTLDVATALPAEVKSGWVRILREEGVWRVRFELTDMGRRVAREASRTNSLPDLAPAAAPIP